MTGPNNPLRLRASRLDGGAPPPLPFVPAYLDFVFVVATILVRTVLLRRYLY